MKPDNVMVTGEGHVVLADFSLSRLVNLPHAPYTPEDPKERERSNREAKRLRYRAPELLFRKDIYSFEVDVWTLGCLLAEVSINEPLFDGNTEIEQLFKIFAFLGVPEDWRAIKGLETVAHFPKWPPIKISHAAFPRQSKEFRELCRGLAPSREKVLVKLVRLSSVLGLEGMKLLEALLQINPAKRPTTESILSHPFFGRKVQEKIEFSPQDSSVSPSTIKGMWDIYIQNEQELKPDGNYLSKQKSINDMMRSILVDWLVDVSLHFELSQSTLHLAVSYLDRAMSRKAVDKSQLQLLGVTCAKIADVFNERSKEYYRQENTKEYVFITAGEYTEEELLELEKEILMLLKFRLSSPTVIHFLDLYCSLMRIDESTRILSQVIFAAML
eukprot:TRINITY_DN2789_c0_g3_i1.p1 TRINITY_DN2789_c0_g3~~TRINITY_DN2789_c0_g3_i1.p1  ORF type:complete len:386 (+),score=88.70 TRINITY_DN2789_c0_g3_i1:969-2126(+)